MNLISNLIVFRFIYKRVKFVNVIFNSANNKVRQIVVVVVVVV